MDKIAAESHNLQISGRAVNAAQGNISIDQQHFDQRQEQNSNATNQINIHFPRHNEEAVFQPRMVPVDQSAAFILRLLEGRGLGSGVIYDDRLVGFSRPQQSENVTQQLSSLWNDTPIVVENVIRSIEKFRSQTLPRDLYDDEVLKNPCQSSAATMDWIYKTLDQTRKEANSVRTTPARLIKSLVDMERHVGSFFSWVCLLPSEDKRSCLCNSISCLILAIMHDIYVDPEIMAAMAEVVVAFTNVQEYIWLYERKGMSVRLHELTVDVFKRLAELTETLLEYAWQGNKLNGSQDKDIAIQLANFKKYLSDVNIESRRLIDPARQNNYYPRAEDLDLEICEYWKRFLDSTPQIGRPVRSTRRRADNPSTLLTPKLQAELGFDRRQFNRHVEGIALEGNVEERQLDQLSSLIRHDDFKTWLGDRSKATALLVHGNFDSDKAISPLSVLCSRFRTESQQGSGSNIVFLHYFCGTQPHGQQQQQASAYDIVRSFTGQLITHERFGNQFDLTFIDSKMTQHIQRNKFADMCRLFQRLLMQLDNTNALVFCFIDSISICETNKLYKNTEQLLATLQKAVKVRRDRHWQAREGPKMLLKVLITDANSTTYAHKYFTGEGMIIEMNQDNEEQNG
ncbi:hypothetical protein F4860DRAFT_480631 [Xylaria cubensis]|nr:hypothetical protein F4860DRAFT_480631 [Xylaria cubensis]